MTDPAAQPSAPQPAAPLNAAEDKQWGSLAHLGGIILIIPTLIIWLVFKDRGPFTNNEGKEALNFQITISIVLVAINLLSAILATVTFGLGGFLGLLGFPVYVVGVVFSIIAFLKAKDGINYRYPFALRLIK